jgi:hypothetical protein
MLDLYDDRYEPVATYNQTIYRVTIPQAQHSGIKTRDIPFAYIGVDIYGLIEIMSYAWDGEYSSHGVSNRVHTEIFKWLVEWELAEWRSIGPEDSDLFATSKLHKGDWND